MTRTLASVRARFALTSRADLVTGWDMKVDLAGLELKELEDFVQSLGHKKFHAKQIYHWIWKRGVTDFNEMTNLSLELRAGARRRRQPFRCPEVIKHDVSSDGTQKFVLRLADGRQIESVFIPDTPKQTFCVSTQVGCAMGCAFCLTGKMGLIRHLSAAEISAPGAAARADARTSSTSPSTSC